MEAAAEQVVQGPPERRIFRQVLWFFPHLAAIYLIGRFSTPWLAAWTRNTLLPLLQMPTSASGFQFLFSHLFVFTVVPAFAAGGLFNAKLRHKVALFVWAIPALILAYKLATFPHPVISALQVPPSIFQRFSPAFHHYFGSDFLIGEYSNWSEFWDMVRYNPDMLRGMDQMNFTVPLYAALAYAAGAWFSIKTRWSDSLAMIVKRWEQERLGHKTEETP